jgi:hypothetical protein
VKSLRIVVYYEGPKSSWANKVDESEVIMDMEVQVQHLYQAQALALGSLGNTGRCGYVIIEGDQIVDKMAAPNSAYSSP